MEPIPLLDLATRKAAWLAARQAVIAGNVANANTPGYRVKDLMPFNDVLAQTQLSLVSTNASHLGPSGANGFEASVGTTDTDNFDITETQNTIGVEGEMSKAGEVAREYALTTNIMKSFHAMLMASVKE